jgi:hypothetical protein
MASVRVVVEALVLGCLAMVLVPLVVGVVHIWLASTVVGMQAPEPPLGPTRVDFRKDLQCRKIRAVAAEAASLAATRNLKGELLVDLLRGIQHFEKPAQAKILSLCLSVMLCGKDHLWQHNQTSRGGEELEELWESHQRHPRWPRIPATRVVA